MADRFAATGVAMMNEHQHGSQQQHNGTFNAFSMFRNRSSRQVQQPPQNIDRINTAVVVEDNAVRQPVTSTQAQLMEEASESSVILISVFAVINLISDIVVLGILISNKRSTETILVLSAYFFALVLRLGAVWQYFERITCAQRLLNIFFGSRLGWSELFEIQLLQKAATGIQFGFPLILHTVADVAYQGISFYAFMIVATAGPGAFTEAEYVAIAACLIATVIAMMATLLIRVSYGAKLIELAVFTVAGIQMIAFVLTADRVAEFEEDKIYTRDLGYPWMRFFFLLIGGFTKTAIDTRARRKTVFPATLTTLVFVLTVIDGVALIIMRTDDDTFTNEGQDILDRDFVADQLIYANFAYDLYVAMFMTVQVLLLQAGYVR